MGMRLTPESLRKIADTAETIRDAGLDVETVRVDNHMVYLKVSDDQRDGRAVIIQGITDKLNTMR